MNALERWYLEWVRTHPADEHGVPAAAPRRPTSSSGK